MDSESLRILLIEDNPIDAHVIRAYLAGSNGFCVDVERTERLSTALACLTQQKFDAAVVGPEPGRQQGAGHADPGARVQSGPADRGVDGRGGRRAGPAGVESRRGVTSARARWSRSCCCARAICHRTLRASPRRAAIPEKKNPLPRLFEQSPDGVLLIDPQTAQALEFNDVVCSYLGYSRRGIQPLADLGLRRPRRASRFGATLKECCTGATGI